MEREGPPTSLAARPRATLTARLVVVVDAQLRLRAVWAEGDLADLLGLEGPALLEGEGPVRAFGADGLRRLEHAFDAALAGAHPPPLLLPTPAREGGRVEVRMAVRPGEGVELLVLDGELEGLDRTRDELRRHYLGKLSDLALMFSFTPNDDARSVIEVATSAVRRMSRATRSSYYAVDQLEGRRVEAHLIYESRPLGDPATPMPLANLSLGENDLELIDSLSVGAMPLAVDELPAGIAPALRQRAAEGAVFLPVFKVDTVRGFLLIEVTEPREWSDEELELLQAAAAMLGATLDRQEARRELGRAEAFSQSVVRAIADGITVVDASGQLTTVNPSGARILDLGREAAGGPAPGSVLFDGALAADGTVLAPESHPVRRALATGEPVYDVVIGLPRGAHDEPVWLEMSAQPLPGTREGGEPVVVCCFSDITARRRDEEELRQARDAALDASRLKGAFLANMSHELRTPMNGILGMASLLLEGELEPTQRDYVSTLKGAAESLLTILDDVLDLSKIEAGRMELERCELDPGRLVEEVVELLAESALDRGLEISVWVSRDVPERVWGDPGRLRQVMTNLVSNAVKFTDVGEVCVRVFKGGGALRFEVVDTGVGLTEEQARRVFERFEQADKSTTRRYGGTGLGLAITRQLIELMGGQIGVSSRPGEGSCFSFGLPVDEVRGPPPPHARLGGARVQLALAFAGCAAGVRRALEEHGAEVVVGGEDDPYVDLLVTDDPVLADAAGVPALLVGGRGEAVGTGGRLPRPLRASHVVRGVARALGDDVEATDPRVAPLARGSVVQSPLRALVAEDHPVNQLVARAMLERLGCEVAVVDDGAAAVAAALDGSFDIVFMDCHMPGVDGLEATRRIRAGRSDSSPHLPIVAVSASAMGPEREACSRAGMDDFLAKPVRLEDFASALTLVRSPRGEPPRREAGGLVLDVEVLERIQAVGGEDNELLDELVGLFREESETRIHSLRAAVGEGDRESIRAHAHSLKGSSSTLGASGMAELCRHLQDHADAMADAELTAAIDDLAGCYEKTLLALRAVREEA